MDWQRMQESMSPEDMDRWLQADRVDPWGNEDLILSAGFAGIINEIRKLTASEENRPELLPPDFFIPKADDNEPEETPRTSFVQTMRNRMCV